MNPSSTTITNTIVRESSVDEERKNSGDYINVRSIKLNEEEGKRKLLVSKIFYSFNKLLTE